MEKPVTVALDDMRRAVWREINAAQLPATILEPVLAGIHRELSAAAQQELACDRRSYEEELEKKEAADEDKNRGNG